MSRSVSKRWILGVIVAASATVALVVSLGADAGTTAVAGVPVATSPPTFTGTAQEGQKLVGHRGVWTESPTDYNDFWVRCDTDGGSCENIAGAHNRAGYTLRNVDVGNTIRFKVQAKNADGTATASSVPSAVVVSATKPLPPTGCAKNGGSIPIAGVSSPARLTIDATQIEPSNVSHSTRSLTARFHVSACGGSVEGASVYVTAVPYAQFSIPNEQTTGSDGWATLQFSALSGYPVSSNQQLLVMFVRARKSGEPLLGGISTRRLVSFRVTN
jgi:hypothetical protein